MYWCSDSKGTVSNLGLATMVSGPRPPLRAEVSSAPSVGSPCTCQTPPSSASWLSLQRCPARKHSSKATDVLAVLLEAASDSSILPCVGLYPVPVTVYDLPPATISCTVIWFSVRVPVLSVQITVVEPRVSTAGSLRIMARFCAMRDTPMARVMVTAAGRPSGMAPTARATAAMKISTKVWPRRSPIIMVKPASPRSRRAGHC